MTDMNNPYQSPEADVNVLRPVGASGGISEKTLFYLKSASPWMCFLGILGFIGSGFLVLFGIFMVTLPAVFLRLQGIASETDVASAMGLGIIGTLGGLAYVVAAVTTFFPARWLYKTGTKFSAYVRSGSELDLEEALRNNRALWKFMGIVTIVWLALIPVGIVITTVAAIGSAFW